MNYSPNHQPVPVADRMPSRWRPHINLPNTVTYTESHGLKKKVGISVALFWAPHIRVFGGRTIILILASRCGSGDTILGGLVGLEAILIFLIGHLAKILTPDKGL